MAKTPVQTKNNLVLYQLKDGYQIWDSKARKYIKTNFTNLEKAAKNSDVYGTKREMVAKLNGILGPDDDTNS